MSFRVLGMGRESMAKAIHENRTARCLVGLEFTWLSDLPIFLPTDLGNQDPKWESESHGGSELRGCLKSQQVGALHWPAQHRRPWRSSGDRHSAHVGFCDWSASKGPRVSDPYGRSLHWSSRSEKCGLAQSPSFVYYFQNVKKNSQRNSNYRPTF